MQDIIFHNIARPAHCQALVLARMISDTSKNKSKC